LAVPVSVLAIPVGVLAVPALEVSACADFAGTLRWAGDGVAGTALLGFAARGSYSVRSSQS
jgi:hypothetical protein